LKGPAAELNKTPRRLKKARRVKSPLEDFDDELDENGAGQTPRRPSAFDPDC
jgi:hypothetical protein